MLGPFWGGQPGPPSLGIVKEMAGKWILGGGPGGTPGSQKVWMGGQAGPPLPPGVLKRSLPPTPPVDSDIFRVGGNGGDTKQGK